MKKSALFALALLAAVPVFAADMSIGGALFWSGDFGGGAKYSDDIAFSLGHDEYVMPMYGFGVRPFFDAEYVEASFSLFWGGGEWAGKKNGSVVDGTPVNASIFSINIDVFGKYPISLADDGKMKIFPLLGLGYHIAVSGQSSTKEQGGQTSTPFDGGYNNPRAIELSALWFKLGGGFDYALNDKLYIRSALLYGIRLANSFESDFMVNEWGGGETRLGHGLTVSAGVGFNL